MEVYVVVDNTSSIARVVEFAKVTYGFGIKNLVLTHVYGSAAQQGVPEAFKVALRYSANLIILSTIKDALSVLNPSHVIVLRRPGPQVRHISELKPEGRVVVIVDGSDQDIKVDAPNVAYAYAVDGDVGGIAQLAVALCILTGRCHVG